MPSTPSGKPGRFLLWAPRVLTILFILFISTFALDAFQENLTLSQAITAFVIHLLPSAILLVILIVSWRWPAGGVLYIVLAGWYIARFPSRPVLVHVIIAGPAILCGALFIIQYLNRGKLRT